MIGGGGIRVHGGGKATATIRRDAFIREEAGGGRLRA